MTILGPSGVTIDCAHKDAEVVEETKICCECIENGNENGTESARDKWFAWRRK
jgi:hypothetical protein